MNVFHTEFELLATSRTNISALEGLLDQTAFAIVNQSSKNISSHACQPKDVSSLHVAMASYFVIALIVALIGNILVCHVIMVTRSLRTSSNVLIVSLAISDVGVAVSLMPFRIAELLNVCLSRSTCIAFMMADITVSTSSVMTLLAIALERALTVLISAVHPDDRNCRRAVIVCVFIWIYSVMCSALAPFDWNRSLSRVSIELFEGKCVNENQHYVQTLFIANFFVPLVIISIIYSWLAKVLSGRAKVSRSYSTAFENSQKFSIRLRKATKTLAVIYSCFVVCWLPNGILMLLHAAHPNLMQKLHSYSASLFFILYYLFGVILPPMNSVLNPFIYGLYHGGVRRAVVEVFIGNWTTIIQLAPMEEDAPRDSQSGNGNPDKDMTTPVSRDYILETAL